MQYEEFIENIMSSEQKIFHPGLVYKSDKVPEIIRKIAGKVYFSRFITPGMIFEELTDSEIDQLSKMTDLFFTKVTEETSEEFIEVLNHNTFCLVTLIQILLTGEGDSEIRKDKEELFTLIAILSNLLKVEKAHRMTKGIAIRNNYSLFVIDKPIFLGKR